MVERILPKTLNADELCEVFNISRRTLGLWTDRKYIPFMRAGKNLFFDYEDVKKTLLYKPYLRPNRDANMAKRRAKGKLSYKHKGKLRKDPKPAIAERREAREARKAKAVTS